MADIDLLVREGDAGMAVAMLQGLGYVESYAQWKHRVFKPADGQPVPGLGEHRDTPVNIELHVRIQERLPVSSVDITECIHPRHALPGLNDYASTGALMGHLLLHAAGNTCNRSLRSEEHTSELPSLMRISYAVFCLKKKINHTKNTT